MDGQRHKTVEVEQDLSVFSHGLELASVTQFVQFVFLTFGELLGRVVLLGSSTRS